MFEKDVMLDEVTMARIVIKRANDPRLLAGAVRVFTPATKGDHLINGVRSVLVGEMRFTVGERQIIGLALQALDRRVAETIVEGIAFVSGIALAKKQEGEK